MAPTPLLLAAISIVDPGGEYFAALSRSCPSASSSSCRSASTIRSSGTRVPHDMPVEPHIQSPQEISHQGLQRLSIATDDEVAGIDSQHAHDVGDEALKPVEFLGHDGGEFVLAGAPGSRWP